MSKQRDLDTAPRRDAATSTADVPGFADTLDPIGVPGHDDVIVRIPTDPRHLRIVRMVAASFASDAGYSIDDVDDVRMAADELCALILEQPVTGPVTVTFRVIGGKLTMWATAAASDPTAAIHPPIDELRAAILGAVTDTHSSTVRDGHVVASFTKAGTAAT